MDSIFLSYAKEDKTSIDRIYLSLKEAGLNPWMDKPPSPFDLDGIPPGQQWDIVLRDRMTKARLALVFLSPTSVAKQGYVQREFRLLLSYQAERPATTEFLVPVLLAPCDLPEHRVDTASLRDLQWFSLYESSLDTFIRYLRRIVNPNSDEARHDAHSSDPEKVALHAQIASLKRQMVAEHDATVAAFEKQLQKIETDRDSWRRLNIEESAQRSIDFEKHVYYR